jgi:arsenate reductase-like glutaredoxin family protein
MNDIVRFQFKNLKTETEFSVDLPSVVHLRTLREIRDRIQTELQIPGIILCDLEAIKSAAEKIEIYNKEEQAEKQEGVEAESPVQQNSETFWDKLTQTIENFELELQQAIEKQAEEIIERILSIDSLEFSSDFLGQIPQSILESETFKNKILSKLSELDSLKRTTLVSILVIGILKNPLIVNKDFTKYITIFYSPDVKIPDVINLLKSYRDNPQLTKAIAEISAYYEIVQILKFKRPNVHTNNPKEDTLHSSLERIKININSDQFLNENLFDRLQAMYLDLKAKDEEMESKENKDSNEKEESTKVKFSLNKVKQLIENILILLIANIVESNQFYKQKIIKLVIELGFNIDYLVHRSKEEYRTLNITKKQQDIAEMIKRIENEVSDLYRSLGDNYEG